MMKSARTVLIISEALTFILMTLMIFFILYFVQMHMKTSYVSMQKQDIGKVDLIIKSFIDDKHDVFSEFQKIPDRKKAAGFMSEFSDVYYLDSRLKITSVIKKDGRSAIFRGYDFSASRPADFFRGVHSSVPVISGLFISPEMESLSIYMASVTSEGLLVGRVDLAALTDTLKLFAEFSSNILLLATREGYILSSTSEIIDLQILPEADFVEIPLAETYMMSKGESSAIDCSIAILTPVSAVYNLFDSMKMYYPLFLVMIFAVMLLKIFVSLIFFIKPVGNFISILSGWVPGSDKAPISGFLSRIREIHILYDTFSRKSTQISSGLNELKQKENEMQVMRNYLKCIIDSMPSIIISTDRNGCVLHWNFAAQAYTGIDAGEAKGKSLIDIFPELADVKKLLDETLCGGNGFEVKKRLFRDTGDVYMNISAFHLSYEDDEGMVVRLDDITHLEKVESNMRQAQKMDAVGALAGGLAHDFNNILSGILGSVSILKIKTESGKDLAELRPFFDKYLGYLEDSVNRSSEIISRLLSLSKKHDTVFTSVNLVDVINGVMSICTSSLDKSVEFEVIKPEREALVKGDSTMLEQALLNLCINGAHAMTTMRKDNEKKGGLLTVTLAEVDPDQFFLSTHPESAKGVLYWSISVKDRGVGMDGEILSNMFDPFFTTKKKYGGTGLGLTMVYNIIQQHGGFIDVYTESGKGSEFIIYMPQGTVEEDETGFANKAVERKGSGLILVIDDEEIIRKVIEELLVLCGFKIIQASDGYEGLKLYRENMDEIKLVLLDIMMPGINGIETFEKIMEINSNASVLLTSGFRDNEKIQNAMERGVKGFIQKPYTLKKLSEAVFKILDNR